MIIIPVPPSHATQIMHNFFLSLLVLYFLLMATIQFTSTRPSRNSHLTACPINTLHGCKI